MIDAGRAEAARMVRVAFDLDRSTFARVDDQAGREATDRERGRVVVRLAWDDIGRTSRVGQDLFRNVWAAAARERDRRARSDQLHEAPPRKLGLTIAARPRAMKRDSSVDHVTPNDDKRCR